MLWFKEIKTQLIPSSNTENNINNRNTKIVTTHYSLCYRTKLSQKSNCINKLQDHNKIADYTARLGTVWSFGLMSIQLFVCLCLVIKPSHVSDKIKYCKKIAKVCKNLGKLLQVLALTYCCMAFLLRRCKFLHTFASRNQDFAACILFNFTRASSTTTAYT